MMLTVNSSDNEDKLPAYFDTFASSLRTNYGSDTSKSYYLSSAPQCPFPDASDPLLMLLLCDFVYVQFYNNPSCEIGSSNFTKSIQQWSTALNSSTLNPKPRLYLGAPAWSAAGNSAYEHIGSAEGMQGIAKSVKDMSLMNFSGVMFWDGPNAMLNTEGGKDILSWTRAGLAQ
jgi:chitinase